MLKTDEGTEGAAICANVTLDNGILRATGPDFASADDGSSVGLRGRLTTHGSSVEAQLTARTGYASYGLYFDKQGSGRGDTWTMGLGKVTAAAGHALSRYSYGLYVDYSSVNALELDGTQLTAMGGESDQYGSQGVFAGEEIIVKNGATVTATGGQVNSSYESVGFNAVSWLTVSGENSKVLGYGGTSVKGDSKGVRCDSPLHSHRRLRLRSGRRVLHQLQKCGRRVQASHDGKRQAGGHLRQPRLVVPDLGRPV